MGAPEPFIIYSYKAAIWSDPWGVRHSVDRLVAWAEVWTLPGVKHAQPDPYVDGRTIDSPVVTDGGDLSWAVISPTDFGGRTYYLALNPNSEHKFWYKLQWPGAGRLLDTDGTPLSSLQEFKSRREVSSDV